MSAVYVKNSSNHKLGKSIDATYLPTNNTCPTSCKLKGAGCYAELSFVGIINSRLNKESKNLSTLDIARDEVKVIDASYKGKSVPNKVLRLHVSGDSKTIKGSKLINSAVARWKKRGGKLAFSYTHAWKTVPRNVWKDISILASIDDISDVNLAVERGYVPSIVVDSFTNSKLIEQESSPVKWIPCPAQTKERASCEECKLCFDDKILFKKKYGIAFEAHGVRKALIKRRLKVI